MALHENKSPAQSKSINGTVRGGAKLKRHLKYFSVYSVIAGAACLLFFGRSEHVEGAAPPSPPALSAETSQAFERYVGIAQGRNEAELRSGRGLLWIDALPETERQSARAALKSGETRIENLNTEKDSHAIPCPGGLVHHWVGAAYIPGVSVNDVLGVLQDYDHQAKYYAPDVEAAKIEKREGDHFTVFLRFRRHKIVTVVLDTHHDVQYYRDSATLAHSRSSAFKINQVDNPGQPSEREKPAGDDDGFLWRMETWWRIDESEGGVYIQSEVLSLTRDIPAGLGWMIGPFVNSIPRETLAFTLEATRKAVLSNSARR